MRGLEGKTAIVTGSARGIGAAISQRLCEEGVTVFGVDQLEAAPDVPWTHIVFDTTDKAAWAANLDTRIEPGSVGMLVNCAAIGDSGTFLEITSDEWDRVMTVNQFGSINGVQYVLPGMLNAGLGSIVNISSVLGEVGMPFLPAYHASKGSIRQLSRHIAVTYADRGVRSNSILPGTIRTPSTEGQAADRNQMFIDGTPMGRQGTAAEVASVVAFLCSEDSSFINGTDIAVDGGFLAL